MSQGFPEPGHVPLWQNVLPRPQPPHSLTRRLIRETNLWGERKDLRLWYFSIANIYGMVDFRVGKAEIKFSNFLCAPGQVA